jgi:hypothetical protein
MRFLAALALATVLALPSAGRADDSWGLTVQLLAGVSRYDMGGLQSGIQNQGADMLNDKASLTGGMLLLRLDSFDVGVTYEGGSLATPGESAVLTPTLGLAIPIGDLFRFDALAELGGHKISGVSTTNGGVDYTQASSVWLPYVGVRPMITLRLPVGPIHLVGSFAAWARWDLVKRDTTLQSAGTSATIPYTLGGVTFGLSAGAGLEF